LALTAALHHPIVSHNFHDRDGPPADGAVDADEVMGWDFIF
jgi:hypothetical protein